MTVDCGGPHGHIAGRAVSWFHVCGLAGLAASVAVASVGAHLRGLPLGPLLPLTALGIGVFLALALATKVVTGEERLTYYHHELAILGSAALFLHAVHRPVLAYLDVVAVGIGAFLVCGRIGCLLVGCCHGRPSRWGVVYGEPHVDAGFPASHSGIPLVPVQLVEATAVTVVIVIALRLAAEGAADGVALGVALVGYGAIRFALEFVRGDVRPTLAGLSEAQWTSTFIALLVLAASVAGARAVPAGAGVTAAVIVAAALLRVTTHFGGRRDQRRFRSPRHASEVLAFVRGGRAADMVVAATSLGVFVSASTVSDGRHWALSWPGHRVDEADGIWLAKLIATARRAGRVPLVTPGNGVVHVLDWSAGRGP